jgi:hypothetical protein
MDVIETSGPHCKVVIRGQPRKEQTATVKKWLTPKWDCTYIFDVLSYWTDILAICMSEEDLISDGKKGKLHLQICKIPRQSHQNMIPAHFNKSARILARFTFQSTLQFSVRPKDAMPHFSHLSSTRSS